MFSCKYENFVQKKFAGKICINISIQIFYHHQKKQKQQQHDSQPASKKGTQMLRKLNENIMAEIHHRTLRANKIIHIQYIYVNYVAVMLIIWVSCIIQH